MKSTDRIAAAVEMVRSGERIDTVCKRIGMTTDVLTKACKAAGVTQPALRPNRLCPGCGRLVDGPEGTISPITMFRNLCPTCKDEGLRLGRVKSILARRERAAKKAKV